MDTAMENTIDELKAVKSALETMSLDNLRKMVIWLRSHEMSELPEMQQLIAWADEIYTKRMISEEFLAI